MNPLLKTVCTYDQDIVWLNIEKGLVYFRNKPIGEGVGANGTLFHGCIGYGTKNQKKCVVKTFPIPTENKQGGFENIELVLGRKLIHKNIVEFYECNQSHSNYYLFMEYCQGGSLQQLITIPGKEESVFESQKLKESDVITIMSQIIDALMYMKKLVVNDIVGCFHRDLKPDNIMFDDKGTPKIIDFGMGKLSESISKVTAFKGSPIYMSPQNLRNQAYDLEKNDVWSVGIILFQLVEGQFPWRCDLESLEDLKDAQEKIKNSQNIKFIEASPNLQKVIIQMLKYNEVERATFDQIAKSDIFSDLLSTKNRDQNQVSCFLSNYDFFLTLQKSFNFPKFDKLVLDITLLEIDKLKKYIAKNSQQEQKINKLYLDRIMKTKRKNYSFKRPQYLKDKLQNRLVDLITSLIVNEQVVPEENFIRFCFNIIQLYNPQVTVEKYQQLEQLLEKAKATI